jgi:hypothetical protein
MILIVKLKVKVDFFYLYNKMDCEPYIPRIRQSWMTQFILPSKMVWRSQSKKKKKKKNLKKWGKNFWAYCYRMFVRCISMVQRTFFKIIDFFVKRQTFTDFLKVEKNSDKPRKSVGPKRNLSDRIKLIKIKEKLVCISKTFWF